jgi:extracellular factor (EF) 3-hydroxypalmitic acid methyl ester biosynthesis protein
MELATPTSTASPTSPALPRVAPDAQDLLDPALHWMRQGDAERGMRTAIEGLAALRAGSGDAWPSVVANEVLTHPLRAVLHQCPFTRHSFERPRGYAGDAALIDYIYGTRDEVLPPLAPLAADIHRLALQAPAPRAVRHRRIRLAEAVDATALRCPRGARVLALAAGHLRVWSLSAAAAGGAIAEWVAFDQDPLSVALVERQYGRHGVTAIAGSVRELLTGRRHFEGYDLVYAAGLFDYLTEPVARRLIERMHAALAPEGRLLVANFLPGIPDVGYMESMMHWHLIYRSHGQMQSLFNNVPETSRANLALDTDPDFNVVYAELARVE